MNEAERGRYERTGLVVATLVNVMPGRQGRMLEPADIYPSLRRPKVYSAELEAALFEAYFKSHNARRKHGRS